MFHFHGFDHGELLARTHDLAFLHLDGDDGSLQGCCDHHRAFGHDLCGMRLDAGTAASLRRRKIEWFGRAIGGFDELADVAIDEVCRDAVSPEIGMRQHGLEESDVGDDAVNSKLAQGARGFGDNVVPGFTRRMNDDLCQQRVEGGTGLVAGVTETIDADAGARRRLEHGKHAAGRVRRPQLVQRLHVDTQLHGIAARFRDRALRQAERRKRGTGGDRELGADEIEAEHLFRYGVLDLEPRVGLDEGKTVVGSAVDQELERAEIVVRRGHGELLRRLADTATQAVAERRARRHLDQLLVPALNGAFAFPEVGDRAVAIADDLHLDMARLPDQPLGIDAVEAERGLGLGLATRIGLREIGSALDHAHAAPAAAGHRLDHDRRLAAERGEERRDVLQRGGPAGAGDDWHAAALCQLPCRNLVAEQFERRRLRPDEGDACIDAGLRERSVLAEEAVAGVHGVAACAPRRLHHGLNVEIGPRAAAGDFDRLIGKAHMQRQRIVRGMDRDRREAGIGCGARDADGDLAAIGDQELLERHAASPCPRAQARVGRSDCSASSL